MKRSFSVSILLLLILSTATISHSEIFTPPKEEWRAVFFGGSQVGYIHERLVPDLNPAGEVTGYGLSGNVEMNIPAMGQVFIIKLTQVVFLNPDFSIRNFDFEMDASGASVKCKGEVVDGELSLIADSMGTKSKDKQKLDGPVFLAEAIPWLTAKNKYKPGSTFKLQIYDFLNTTLAKITAEVIKMETIEIEGEKYESYVVRQNYFGFEQDTWVSLEGISLKETSQVSGMGFQVLKTTEEKALRYGANPVSQILDLVDSSKISVDKMIKNPHGVKKLKVKVRGVSAGDFISGSSD